MRFSVADKRVHCHWEKRHDDPTPTLLAIGCGARRAAGRRRRHWRSRGRRAGPAIAALKPEGFPTPADRDHRGLSGRRRHGHQRPRGRSTSSRSWSGERSLVNNRTGGAGLVGHTWLATQAPKDGHAVGVIANLIFADAMLRKGAGATPTSTTSPT